jgi:hypothetical protein
VNNPYKGLKTGKPIGTGSTADVLRYETATGQRVGGRFHRIKATESVTSLRNWLRDRAMSLLEAGMGSPDPLLQELVAVSFIENLDPADESFSTIRKLFGPALEEQYLIFENFDPYEC